VRARPQRHRNPLIGVDLVFVSGGQFCLADREDSAVDVRFRLVGRPQDRLSVAAAGSDDVRVGDREVVQVVADDRVVLAVEFAAECGQLDFALSQCAVGEQ
jgi:hypothetical protein